MCYIDRVEVVEPAEEARQNSACVTDALSFVLCRSERSRLGGSYFVAVSFGLGFNLSTSGTTDLADLEW